jgi:hypothetical protein
MGIALVWIPMIGKLAIWIRAWHGIKLLNFLVLAMLRGKIIFTRSPSLS